MMYDYYAVLERMTDNMGIKAVDQYHEWVQMNQEYRHMKMLKRGGWVRYYDPSGVDSTKLGALAICCPACPRPGVNLPEDWEDATEEEWHMYTFFLALDACFRLKQRLFSSELKDPGLGVGWAYMLENEPYRDYLRTVTDQKEMNTCSGLAALDANTKFSRGYVTTGPNGVGDLQRSERFPDLPIWTISSGHQHPHLQKLILYDIMCIWKKFLKERRVGLPNLMKLNVILTFFKFVIPKMHIHAHALLCQLLYSLNLAPGSAQVDGEGIERPWVSIGGVAMSTILMGPGARHGVLDCQWSHWNWQKLVGLANGNQLQCCAIEWIAAFDMFLQEHSDRVPKWKKAVHDFEKTSVNNPYEIKVKGQTEAEVHLQFAEEEVADAARGITPVHDVSPSKFLTIRLEIEEEQHQSGCHADEVNSHNQFQKLQATYMPVSLQILRSLPIGEEVLIEDMPLLLPSTLTAAQREGRNVQCHAALGRLRTQLNIKSRLLIYTKHQSRHQKRNTWSKTLIAHNESKIHLHLEKYQVAWEAI
ncbi:hypothetical protein DFH07DRAFT_866577 [Mycena maculata]|uniref:CxC2-like cysteine cluster KDZ transposase-associated domain-containing protein n=1 Tax=Mycena maculata TaxID=230809 RepID=A0AAD7NQ61_9AGAR|nr:hypothetical protein DFH07DRAFT_866577 [Mycena maculata]